MNALDTAYEKLRAWGAKVSNLSQKHRVEYENLMQVLSDAIQVFTKEVDRSSVQSCLETVAYHKGLQSHHLKETYWPCLMDLFNSYEIAALFRAEQSTIHRRLDKYKRGDKKGGLWDGDIDVPYSPEEIDEMDNDLFLDVAMRGARRTIILATYSKKIDRNSVDVANRLLLAQDQLKRGETEKMWKLNKRWLNFFTSDFVIHLTKILSPFKLKVDAKILVSEALDEGYRDLYKIFVKAQEQQEEDAMAGAVKAAKRRGSWKKKRSKVVGSTVLTEDAESIENTAPESDASTQEGSG